MPFKHSAINCSTVNTSLLLSFTKAKTWDVRRTSMWLPERYESCWHPPSRYKLSLATETSRVHSNEEFDFNQEHTDQGGWLWRVEFSWALSYQATELYRKPWFLLRRAVAIIDYHRTLFLLTVVSKRWLHVSCKIRTTLRASVCSSFFLLIGRCRISAIVYGLVLHPKHRIIPRNIIIAVTEAWLSRIRRTNSAVWRLWFDYSRLLVNQSWV